MGSRNSPMNKSRCGLGSCGMLSLIAEERESNVLSNSQIWNCNGGEILGTRVCNTVISSAQRSSAFKEVLSILLFLGLSEELEMSPNTH